MKTINLKAMVAIVHTCYETLMRTLDSTADIVLSWLEENRESISAELNFPHFIAMVMMAKKRKEWHQPNNKGELVKYFTDFQLHSCYEIFADHRKLLWEFCNDKKHSMVRYLLSIPGIRDVKMDDGTTAFSMALGRKDFEMIRIFLDTKHASDIDPIALAERTFHELGRDDCEGDPALKRVLEQSLRQHNVVLTKRSLPQAKISNE